nr:hypothetical protein JLTIEETK_JLTIEETK_CDS_0005 [Microvirus sp.]
MQLFILNYFNGDSINQFSIDSLKGAFSYLSRNHFRLRNKYKKTLLYSLYSDRLAPGDSCIKVCFEHSLLGYTFEYFYPLCSDDGVMHAQLNYLKSMANAFHFTLSSCVKIR